MFGQAVYYSNSKHTHVFLIVQYIYVELYMQLTSMNKHIKATMYFHKIFKEAEKKRQNIKMQT